MRVDLHAHFFPLEAFQKAEKYREAAPQIVLRDGRYTVSSPGGSRGNLGPGAYDPEARMRELDQMGIDLQALSPSPILLFYWAEAEVAAYFSRLQNGAIQAVAEAHPDRFVGFGTVPLQSVSDAVAIAEEAKKLGLSGLEVGTQVEGKYLDDAEFEPFFATAQRLGLLLFVHPLEGGAVDRGDPATGILGNVLEFPYHTTFLIERMILKGLFEKYLNLRLCLAHGGGLLPYNIWRLDHAYAARGDLRKNLPRRPSEYLKQMYFDSIVHSVVALQFLIEVVGADRVVIGTDYPMAMGDKDPVTKVMALRSVSAEQRDGILGNNALAALGRSGRA